MEVLQAILLPFSRRKECSKCRAGLNRCLDGQRNDAEAADAGHKSRTGFTLDKETANLYDFFIGGIKAHNQRFNAAARKIGAVPAKIFGKKLQSDAASLSQTNQTGTDQALAEIKGLLGESK